MRLYNCSLSGYWEGTAILLKAARTEGEAREVARAHWETFTSPGFPKPEEILVREVAEVEGWNIVLYPAKDAGFMEQKFVELGKLDKNDLAEIPAALGRVRYDLAYQKLQIYGVEALSLQQVDCLAYDLQRLGRLLQIYVETKMAERGEQ